MEIIGLKTVLFNSQDNLLDFLDREIKQLKNGEVVVITSKIVALAEGRTGEITDKKKIIKKEAQKVIETPWASLTLTSDGWCLNAGIDESNADRQLILTPTEPFRTAWQIRQHLIKKFKLKHLGLIITDTKSLPLRRGTVGRTLGYAGFEALKSYVGKKDLFGRANRLTKTNVADALSASAVLVMGEGNERTPLAIIKDAPVKFINQDISLSKEKNLSLPPDKDIFAKVYKQKRNERKYSPRPR
jgi:coenzyme F420-0:L-glutamate ligase